MKKIVYLFALFISFQSFCQIGKSTPSSEPNTVSIEKIREGKSNPYFNINVQPLNVSLTSSFIYIGYGFSAEAVKIKEKFCLSVDYTSYYGKYNFNDKITGFVSPNFDSGKASTKIATFGYIFAESSKQEVETINLKKVGNTQYVTEVEAEVFRSKIARIGYYGNSQFLSSTEFDLFHSINNISLGFGKLKTSNTVYRTDKYGEVNSTFENLVYYDLLIALPSKFSYVDSRVVDEYNKPDGVKFVSIDNQNIFREGFRKMPIGFRIGANSKSRGLKGKSNHFRVTTLFEAGMYSGYYQNTALGVLGLFYAKMGLSFGFHSNL